MAEMPPFLAEIEENEAVFFRCCAASATQHTQHLCVDQKRAGQTDCQQHGPSAHSPTTDAVFVLTDTSTDVRLCNLIGQTISTQTVQNGSAIDPSNLPNGLYFLLERETGQIHKILKN